jgi:hypothetical protein
MTNTIDLPLFRHLQVSGNPLLDSGATKHNGRQRGLRSFLTWSFFLAQIAAAETFFGDAAKAATGQGEDGNPASAGPRDDAAPQASGSVVSVAAAGDPASDARGNETQLSEIGSGAAPLDQNAAAGTKIDAFSGAGDVISVTGGGGGGGPGQASGADLASELAQDGGLGIDLAEIVNLDDAAPALIGDPLGSVVTLLGETLDELAATPLLGDIVSGAQEVLADAVGFATHTLSDLTGLSAAGDLLSRDGNGGLAALFPAETAGGAQLMQLANAAQDSLSAPLFGGAALGVHYSDLTLSLSADVNADTASPLPPATSLLHSLPVIGDVLGGAPADGEIEYVSSADDVIAAAVQVTDHADMAKIHADLWS